MSDSTGMIYNDEMNDFSIPVAASDGLLPAPANFIAPGKSPVSSMSPIIILNDKKEVTLVLGGAGGILIMTSIVQFLVNYLYLNQSVETSLAMKRLHHQLQPMSVRYEDLYDENVLRFLESKGHVTVKSSSIISGFASLNAVANKNGKIEAAIDPRRGGKVAYV
jgi:gamma-glutamyltranspeptidase